MKIKIEKKYTENQRGGGAGQYRSPNTTPMNAPIKAPMEPPMRLQRSPEGSPMEPDGVPIGLQSEYFLNIDFL